MERVMICEKGNSTLSLSEQDLWIAIEDFLNKGKLHRQYYKIQSMKMHKKGSIKSVTVEVILK
jgi:hypothetical protein